MRTLRGPGQRIHPAWFLSPVIMYYLVFWLRPTLLVIAESFKDIDGTMCASNFSRLLSQPEVRTAFLNTIVFTVGSAALQFILALTMALWLNKKFKFSNLILFISLIPMAFPPAAVGILWKTGLYRFGWINSFLCSIGAMSRTSPVDWMSLRGFKAVALLVVVDTWTVLPAVMIILLAGLQNLNKEYEEAGLVFGAGKLQVLKDIVLPILRPTIITAMILRIIAAIQVWLIAVMIFGYNVVPLLVERIAYNVDVISFGRYAKKDAYALSVVVVVIVILSVSLYLRASRGLEEGVER